MTPKMCDQLSVGLFIRRGREIAVIFRKNYPQAYALPAGHLDGKSFYNAAIKEAREEVGIAIEEQILVHEGSFQNPCGRSTGTGFHSWRVYEPLAWQGTLCAGSDAAKAIWMNISELREKAHMTRAVACQLNIYPEDLAHSTPLIVNHPWWKKYPGLEPVWYIILNRMGLLFAPLPPP
ncbi:MAG: NUDIX hydrolase [Candidatus Sungbacteria bacterium]|nr:NUDIX hydrolase [Candidatus Sungbacteria bacterium]